MDYTDLRITKLRTYLLNIIDSLNNNRKSQLNADMLSSKVDDYSLDKVPTELNMETWIIGTVKRREVYSLRSRKIYSEDTINNLKNIGFFEKFEDKIKFNNENGILPDIENIEKIECLNCGTMIFADTNTAEFDIQIQITFRETQDDSLIISL